MQYSLFHVLTKLFYKKKTIMLTEICQFPISNLTPQSIFFKTPFPFSAQLLPALGRDPNIENRFSVLFCRSSSVHVFATSVLSSSQIERASFGRPQQV